MFDLVPRLSTLFYSVLLRPTSSYFVLLRPTSSYCVLLRPTSFYFVLPRPTSSYLIPPRSTSFYLILLRSTSFYFVLPRFTSFYLVLARFTSFYFTTLLLPCIFEHTSPVLAPRTPRRSLLYSAAITCKCASFLEPTARGRFYFFSLFCLYLHLDNTSNHFCFFRSLCAQPLTFCYRFDH